MRIRMLKLAAGPAGVRAAGGEYDLPDAEARSLIQSGAAEAIDTGQAPPTETADAARPAAEQRPAHGPAQQTGRNRKTRGEAKPDDADGRDRPNE